MSSEKPFQKALLCIPAVLAAMLTCMSPSASGADAEAEPKRVVVSFADLNLECACGNEVLNRRIQRAAEAVCADLDSGKLDARMRYEDCLREATQRALAEVRQVRK